MPADWRAIGEGGVQIDYRTYNCADLGPYRRMPSGVAAKGGRWEVHYDPYDLSCFQAAWNITRVWARKPHCRPRLRARWQARAARLGPGTALGSRAVTFPEAIALAEILTDPGGATWQQLPGRSTSSTGASAPGSSREPTRRPPTTTRSSPGPATTAAAGLEGD